MSGRDGGTGEGTCPTCGPTTLERHPRRKGVLRCANCKEWLDSERPVTSDADPASTSASEVEGLVRVLTDHVLHAGGGNHWFAECLSEDCDWSEQGTGGLVHGIEAHRNHVATLLAAREAAAETRGRAEGWDEGHRHRQRRGPDDCRCGAYYAGECGCGKYGSGPLVSLNDNPYHADSLAAPRGDGEGK